MRSGRPTSAWKTSKPGTWSSSSGTAWRGGFADARTAPGNFVPLFNGKDLTGWKTHPDQPGDWRVENGVLIGRGPLSHLFSERGDYENFHLRVEAKINS